MDKYQAYLMGFKDSYYKFATNGSLAKESVLVNDKIILTQNEDISINDYVFYIVNDSVESVFAVKGSEQKEFFRKIDNDCANALYSNKSQEKFFIAIDFDNKFDGIRIVFKNNLADNLFLPLEYVLADKEKYYEKKEQERRNDLLKAADIKISTGTDLVNIYFQPCCGTYSKTIIELYTATGKFEQRHISSHCITFINESAPAKLLDGTANMIIGQFKVEQGMFFKSITGLAHGVYAIKLIQYDENNNELLKSDYLFFVIR